MKSLIKLSIIALTAMSLFTACSGENKEVTETTTSNTSQVSNSENQSAENTNIIASENDTEITLSENANIPSFEDIIKKCDKNTKYDSILRIDYNDGYALMSNNKVMLKTNIANINGNITYTFDKNFMPTNITCNIRDIADSNYCDVKTELTFSNWNTVKAINVPAEVTKSKPAVVEETEKND